MSQVLHNAFCGINSEQSVEVKEGKFAIFSPIVIESFCVTFHPLSNHLFEMNNNFTSYKYSI
jgi:hypothetical protein